MPAKRNNWLLEQAKNADPTKGSVTLEDPELINELDKPLKGNYWPFILEHLQTTGLHFEPENEPRICTNLSHELMRCLEFMFLDELGKAISRISFRCGKTTWMINSEFFLGLPQETSFRVIHDLISNSRLTGNPPTLEILKQYPESYYNITFQAGSGESWGMTTEDGILGKVKKTVDVNIELYMQSIEGIEVEDVSEFLTTAYTVYEAF